MPVLGLLPPPSKEFSDLPYVAGNALTGVRYISGPGENVGADARRCDDGRRRRRRGDDGRRGGQRERVAAGAAAAEAAVRAASRAIDLDRGEIRLAGRARRDAGQRPQSSGAEGADDSAHRPVGRGRRARDEDAGDRRRSAGDDRCRTAAARRDAARLRQDERQGSRRGLHAGAAVGHADDLRAQRQAVHRRRRSAAATTRANISRLRCRGRQLA